MKVYADFKRALIKNDIYFKVCDLGSKRQSVYPVFKDSAGNERAVVIMALDGHGELPFKKMEGKNVTEIALVSLGSGDVEFNTTEPGLLLPVQEKLNQLHKRAEAENQR